MRMKTGVEVTSRRGEKGVKPSVVGVIDIEIFDTEAEANQFYGSEEKVLKLINTQHATNRKNDVRRLANVTLSDNKCEGIAIDRVLHSKEIMAELINAPDLDAARDAAVKTMMATIRQEFEDAAAGAVPPASEDADADDPDDD